LHLAEVVDSVDEGSGGVGAGLAVGVGAVGVQLLDLLHQGGSGVGNVLGGLGSML